MIKQFAEYCIIFAVLYNLRNFTGFAELNIIYSNLRNVQNFIEFTELTEFAKISKD